MTLSISNPRAKSRWTLLSIIVGLGLILGMMIPMVALAAPPKISLEQCRNGSASVPNDCELLGGSSGWQNGNAGASNAHFVEGHSIPYRALLTDAPGGENTVLLGYDVKHSDVHAIDFLTHFQRLQPHGAFEHPAEDVDPTSGVSGLNADIATCPIDAPSNLSTAAAATFEQIKTVESKAVFTVYGADSCTVTQDTEGDLTQKQSEARVLVTFNATNPTVVMAWGGHIARSPDWQPAGGAAQISGSPYHMRLKAWSAGNVGNQDRSLSAAAVIAEDSSTATTLHFADDSAVPLTAGVGVAPLGSTIHDLATVTGFNPTGTVTFNFFTNGDCTGTPSAAGTVPLVAVNSTTSVAHPSDSRGPLAAGTYAFQATYNGDSQNSDSTSPCEPFTVSKGDLTITTHIHLSDGADPHNTTNYDANVNATASVPINSTVHDVAFASGAVTGINPTGAITFTRYDNGACTGDAAALATADPSADGSGVRSVDFGPLAPGSYSFKATIAADTNYNTAIASCERLVVDQASPTLSTSPWIYPNDSATISGLVSPQAGSTLTFTAHTANSCDAESQIYQRQFSDITSQTYDTDNTTIKVTSTSSVWWKVVYSGDANNLGATSDCVERIDVTLTPDPIPES